MWNGGLYVEHNEPWFDNNELGLNSTPLTFASSMNCIALLSLVMMMMMMMMSVLIMTLMMVTTMVSQIFWSSAVKPCARREQVGIIQATITCFKSSLAPCQVPTLLGFQ